MHASIHRCLEGCPRGAGNCSLLASCKTTLTRCSRGSRFLSPQLSTFNDPCNLALSASSLLVSSLKIDSSAMPFFRLPSPSRLSDPARAHHAYVMHMAWFSSPRHRIQCTPSRLQNLQKEVCNLAARFFFTLSQILQLCPSFVCPLHLVSPTLPGPTMLT